MQDSFDRSSAFKALNSGVAVLNPAQTVWTAMLDGWDRQQLSRGLTRSTILSRRRIVQRFQSFTASYPWEWRSGDLDDFSVELNSPTRRAYSTLRQYHGAIETFCSYLVDPSYDWAELCERQFGQSPSQICSPFNTVRHANDYEGHPARRPFTYDELQRLFDCADARVDLITGGGKKGGLAALRDAQLFKTVYAFGLRRAEVVGLDMADLHHSAGVPQWERYGSVQVRWGKSSRGGPPRRRTVLLVPEFDWWVGGMRQWVETARDRFGSSLPALWVTERDTRLSLGYVDRRLADIRDEAGLPRELSLHSLRHSYATHLVEFGYPERFVQEQLGHAFASTTAIYTSVSGDFKNRILASALQRLLPKAQP